MPPLCESSLPAIESELQLLGNPPLGESPSTRTGMILLALWVYATADSVGSARALARLCEHHTIYRWICSGVGVNHPTLPEFRVENGDILDRLMTQSLAYRRIRAALIAEGLLSLHEVATDGTKVRAAASKSSPRRAASLQHVERDVAGRIAALTAEVDQDGAPNAEPGPAGHQSACRDEGARRGAGALGGQAPRGGGQHPKAELRVSTTDPDARMMRMADDAMRPCFNIQLATASGFVVAVSPTNQCNDHDLAGIWRGSGGGHGWRGATDMRRPAGPAAGRCRGDDACGHHRLGRDAPRAGRLRPARGLETRLDRRKPEPPPPQPGQGAALPPAMARAHGPTPEAEAIYARRGLTEHVHAKIKNRGFGRMLVRGLDRVHAVCLLHALTHTMLHALTRRAALAAPQPARSPRHSPDRTNQRLGPRSLRDSHTRIGATIHDCDNPNRTETDFLTSPAPTSGQGGNLDCGVVVAGALGEIGGEVGGGECRDRLAGGAGRDPRTLFA